MSDYSALLGNIIVSEPIQILISDDMASKHAALVESGTQIQIYVN